VAAFAFQNVPPAPGRPSQPGTQAPAPAQETAQGVPEQQAPAEGGGIFTLLGPLLLFIPLILIMFFSSRSQQKKQRAALDALKKGDRVVTQSGFVGKLVEIGDRYAKLEIAPGVKVEVLKSGLLGKDSADAAAAIEKKK
jgi:preprotein translocase subunit YajC